MRSPLVTILERSIEYIRLSIVFVEHVDACAICGSALIRGVVVEEEVADGFDY